MASEKVTTTVDRFGGLSDRAVPIKATRIESPDLNNVDFSERVAKRRNGYSRLHSNRFGDAALRLSPPNLTGTFDAPHARIPTRSFMYPGGATTGVAWYIGIGCVLANLPDTSNLVRFVASKGYGSSSNLHWSLTYDATIQDPATSGAVGGWRAIFNGATQAANLYVVDGTAAIKPLNQYRFLELTIKDPTGELVFTVYDANGNVIGTNQTASAWTSTDYVGAASSEDITLGVGMSASDTLNSLYFDGTIAEFRIAVGTAQLHKSIQTLYAGRWAKEIPDTFTGASLPLMGYYRLNDGNSTGRIYDRSQNANHGSLPYSPPSWVFDETEVLGASGLEWRHKQQAYAQLVCNGFSLQRVFIGATAVSGQRWTLRGICVPKLPPGATIAPRGVILWAGSGATPAPLAIGVNLDGLNPNRFQAIYMDDLVQKTLTLNQIGDPLVSDLAGKKVRFALTRRTVHTGIAGFTNDLLFQIAYETNTGTHTPARTIQTTATTANVAFDWYIGARVTNPGIQNNGTVGTIDFARGCFCGIIDDVQLIWNGKSTLSHYVAIGSNDPSNAGYFLNEISDWGFSNNSYQTVFYLKFNDGYGNRPAITGNYNDEYTCTLFPSELNGYRWDAGIVEPYQIVRPRGLWDYKTFRANGSTERRILAVAGSGLYEIPVNGGVAKLVASGIFKSNGRVSFGQYGSNVIMAEPNGRRPMIYDGTTLRQAGINAPTYAPIPYQSTTGGTLAAGTYYVYYTFVNTVTGDESNPSPGYVVTLTTATSSIHTVAMMLSADPQVNARRLYITGLNGVDGATAYLVATIEDNETVNYGSVANPAITAVPTGTTLEYFNNNAAPQAAIVGVFRDAAFLGGNSLFPTRLYRSSIGSLTRYDPLAMYLDLDLDSGDPITHMIRTNNYLLVSMRDGTARVYNTGDSNAPFGFDFLPIKHGAVGAQAASYAESSIFYMSDDDCFRTDGQNEQNISSPDNPLYPSIQYTMREGLNDSLKDLVSVAVYHPRNQVWFCCASSNATSNDIVLVYDSAQGIWTRFTLPIDCVVQAENDADASRLIGSVNGYVSILDTGSFDGVTSLVTGVATAGTTTSVTVSGTPTIAHGLTVHIYNFASQTVVKGVVATTSVSGGNTTITFYDSLGLAPANGDKVVVGGIPFYIDFVFDWGNPGRKKRLRWVKVAGVSDNDGNFLRCGTLVNKPGRAFVYTNAKESWIQYRASDAYRILMIGGEARSCRIRLSETSDPSMLPPTPLPSAAGTIQLVQVEGVAELLDIE